MDRRDFLKIGAAGAAGAGLAGCGLIENRNKPRPYKIKGVERMKLSWEPYELQLRHTFTVATASRTTTPDVQVRIDYDGFTGWGEASMPPYLGHTVESVCKSLARIDLAQFDDPFKIEDILAYIDSLGGIAAPAKAAVDIALHDLYGKLLAQPLWRIWGLNPAKTPATTFTIGIDTPEVVREKTKEAAGKFAILKVKVGLGLEKDLAMIDAIRSVTSLPLAVDANQGWTDKFEAMSEIFELQERGVVMVEQPMPRNRLEDTAWLRSRCSLPIFADESVQGVKDIARLRGAFDGINIKLMKCGGLAEARKMMALARGFGMKVMLGCMTETSCAVTAAAQLSPGVDFADLDGNLLISNDRFAGVTVGKDGRLVLPDGAGLGLTLL